MKLILRNIEKSFDKKEVLNNATFTFEEGKIYGLLGRNGAGKTTLFNCISGDDKQDSGDIELIDDSGKNIMDYSSIGYVFAEPVLPEFLTGYEFLKFYLDINKGKIENPLSIDEYFEIMKIDKEDRERLIKDYSFGMKNKMQMLCYLITQSPVILLDEPLTSFDVVVAYEIKQLLKKMKTNHIILFSTHIMELASELCDEIVILNNGELKLLNKEIMESDDYEEKIMDILKEDKGNESVS